MLEPRRVTTVIEVNVDLSIGDAIVQRARAVDVTGQYNAFPSKMTAEED